MTVSAYGVGSLAASRSDATFKTLKADLARLQEQLATGRVASDHAGLGSNVTLTLSARSSLAAISGYQSNVADAGFRLKLADAGVSQIGKIAQSLATGLPGSFQATPVGQTTAITSAEDGLRQVIDILNSQVNGRFLFAGRAADTEPVASLDFILNGDATRTGLKGYVAERKAADAGPDGRGRLVLGGAGTGATLSEEAAGLPFGFKVAGASATGAGVSAGTSAGPPASATLDVTAQPVAGDTVTLRLGLPDGTETTLTLKAGAAANGASGTFAIGGTPADTAANLRAALATAVAGAATTTLASASAARAASDFFSGSLSNPPPRVAGPPVATATTSVPGTDANTAIWYAGEDGAGSARETAPVRTGDGTAVAIGLRANEPGFRDVLAALGALAADTFTPADPTSRARYAAATERVGKLAGRDGVTGIAADLSVAKGALDRAGQRLTLAKAQYEDIVASVEQSDPNAVATALLETQTRLQASYQSTAAIARMSLVDYL